VCGSESRLPLSCTCARAGRNPRHDLGDAGSGEGV